jgi:hypothetical protein
MQGCARSCLVQLGLWGALAAGSYLYLRSIRDAGVATIVVAVVTGLLAAMAALLLHGVYTSIRERKMLLAATGGAPPRDGEWIAVSGEIRSLAPVRGPLSGEPVVAYEYQITREVQMGGSRSIVPYFEGKALSASTITTPYGAVRVLAVPRFEMEPAGLDRASAIANARAYIRATTFEPRETAKQRSDALAREWTDDDGVFRIDKKIFGAEVDLEEGFQFEERQVRQGERVCAFGVYSEERRGIVPDQKWGRHSRIGRGGAEEMAAALRGRMMRYSTGSLFLAGAAAWGVILYLRS